MGRRLLVTTLAVLMAVSMVPYLQAPTAEAQSLVQTVLGDSWLQYDELQIYEVTFELNSTANEEVVGAYPGLYNGEPVIFVITTERIVWASPWRGTAGTYGTYENTNPKLAVASDDGTIYIVNWKGSTGNSFLYMIDKVEGHQPLVMVSGYPLDADAAGDWIAVVTHVVDVGLRLYVINSETLGQWSTRVDISPTTPDQVDYVVVAVQGEGKTAVAVGSGSLGIISLYSDGEEIARWEFGDTTGTSPPYVYVAWAGDDILVVQGRNPASGDVNVTAYNVSSGAPEMLWTKIYQGTFIRTGPGGCCVYLPFTDSILVINATTGEFIDEVSLATPFAWTLVEWPGDSPWGLAYLVDTPSRIFLVPVLGGYRVEVDQSVLWWEPDGGVRYYAPVAAGLTPEGDIYLVQAVRTQARVAVVEWPKYHVLYLETEPYYGIIKPVTCEGGYCVRSRLVLVEPGITATLTYHFEAVEGTPQSKATGLIEWIGVLERVAEENFTLTITTEEMGFTRINVTEQARSRFGLVYASIFPGDCPLDNFTVSWETGEYTEFYREPPFKYAAAPGNYTITAYFYQPEPFFEWQRRILFGQLPPTIIDFEIRGGETLNLTVKPAGFILGVIGEGSVYIENLETGEGTWRYPEAENWTYYCMPAGQYRIRAEPDPPTVWFMVPDPDEWGVNYTVQASPGYVMKLNLTEVLANHTATVIVYNDLDQSYGVHFEIFMEGDYRLVGMGEVLGSGDSGEYLILANTQYRIVVEPKQPGTSTEEYYIELTPAQPGQVIEVYLSSILPGGQEEQATTTTTTPPETEQPGQAPPAGQGGEGTQPTEQGQARETPARQQGTTTTEAAGGEGGGIALAAGLVGVVVVLAAAAYILILRR